jgi:RNA polymerase sigma-70 factor (ECF subfamily)
VHALEPAPAPAPAADPGALFARHRPAVWRYLRVLGCDAALADDLTQETFLVVLRRPGFDASEPRAAFAFLRTTARHLYLKARRRRAEEREVAEADAVWDARCGDDAGAVRLQALRDCVASLPARSRSLLQSTYGAGASRRAAGRPLGLGVDGVKSALRRLRAFLHACIERRSREEER